MAVRDFARVPSLTRQVGGLQGDLAALTHQVGELQGEFAALRPQVGGLEGDLAALARQIGELRGDLAALTAQVGGLQGDLAALARQVGELQGGLATLTPQAMELNSELDALKAQFEQERASRQKIQDARDLSNEITRCRAVSEGTVFVLGFARSSTTISTEILNSSTDVFILAEANFYLPHQEHRFRDWYNRMHFGFDNQVSKTTYAPDFVPEVDHDWLDWLCAAKTIYPFVGDKMAFSAQHFNFVPPCKIQSFFEARFFKSKYVFTIRDPIQTLLSAAKLFGISTDCGVIAEIIAWLRFVQLWADWVRIFGSTITFDADELDHDTIYRLQKFIGTDLSGAEFFIDKRRRTNHLNVNAFPILNQVKDELTMVFDLVKAAMKNSPSQWQLNGEVRGGLPNGRASAAGPVELSKTPIFRAWAMCEKLIRNLQRQLVST